jgi:hypothetical protein
MGVGTVLFLCFISFVMGVLTAMYFEERRREQIRKASKKEKSRYNIKL